MARWIKNSAGQLRKDIKYPPNCYDPYTVIKGTMFADITVNTKGRNLPIRGYGKIVCSSKRGINN